MLFTFSGCCSTWLYLLPIARSWSRKTTLRASLRPPPVCGTFERPSTMKFACASYSKWLLTNMFCSTTAPPVLNWRTSWRSRWSLRSLRSSETKRSVRQFLSPHQFGDHVNLEDKSLRSAICAFIRDSWNAQPCLRIIVIKTCYLIPICPFIYLALISQIFVNSAVLLVRVPLLRVGVHSMTSSPVAHYVLGSFNGSLYFGTPELVWILYHLSIYYV